MPDKKITRKRKAPSLRATAERLLAEAKRSGTIKGGAATPGGGLLARIAATKAAQAAAAAGKGAAQGAAKGATGTNKAPWVRKALEGSLPTKTFKGAAPSGGLAEAMRGSPANAKSKKKMTPMPKKAAPKKAAQAAPKKSAPKREAASSNTYRKPKRSVKVS